MPWYYFDIDDGQRNIIDDDGNALSDPEAARDQALAMLPKFARLALTGEGSREVTVAVRNEASDVVFTATMSLRSKWLIEPSKSRLDP